MKQKTHWLKEELNSIKYSAKVTWQRKIRDFTQSKVIKVAWMIRVGVEKITHPEINKRERKKGVDEL